MPTNIAFHPSNGDFYVADGYGAYVVHVYDKTPTTNPRSARRAKKTASSICRTACGPTTARADEPSIVVADRVNDRLQWFTLDGKHLETVGGFLLPANVDTFGDLMLVPELQARVTLLDGKNKVVARLGR